jgi:hypothetical protein
VGVTANSAPPGITVVTQASTTVDTKEDPTVIPF